MERIDAHQHFWRYDPARLAWIGEAMGALKRDFLPADLAPLLARSGLDGCVAVQAAQSEEENRFLLDLADTHPFVRGVVGWVDLEASDLEERLERYRSSPKLKGFRHVLQDEPQRDSMLRPAFRRGIARLRDHGYTYDLLVLPDQLPAVLRLVRGFPDQPFVVDHLAKPPIRTGQVEAWRRELRAVGACENVCCKVSGLVTEAEWAGWKPEHFVPYLDAVVEIFGTGRLMYGSDWPVCSLAAPYERTYELVERYFSGFQPAEREAIFGGNAVRFYRL